jgi:hypothetical protein
MKRLFIIPLFAALIMACESGENGIKNSGEVILTSERILTDTYRSVGFSFKEGKNVPFPAVGGVVPDIVVTNETDLEGNITGAIFTSPNNLLAFHMEGSFNSFTEALNRYNEYKEVTAEDFTALANPVIQYQLWTMRTAEQKFAKLVVKDIRIKTDSPVSDYIEVTIEYQYQPDGTAVFSD